MTTESSSLTSLIFCHSQEGYVPERRKQLNRLKNELLHGEYDSPSSSRGQNGEELDDNANEEVGHIAFSFYLAMMCRGAKMDAVRAFSLCLFIPFSSFSVLVW